jgi:hypothetical protein
MRAELAVVRRWPSVRAREWVQRLADEACSSPYVDALVGIGSAVRDVGHQASDVDLVVIYHRRPPSLAGKPIDVDIRAFPREEVGPRVASGHDLLGWGIRYGAAVCDRDGYWADLRARWNRRLPLPSPIVSLERAARTERLARDLLCAGDQDAALELLVSTLTHRARARLSQAGVYPASRPELPVQLREVGEHELAGLLADTLAGKKSPADVLASRREAASVASSGEPAPAAAP